MTHTSMWRFVIFYTGYCIPNETTCVSLTCVVLDINRKSEREVYYYQSHNEIFHFKIQGACEKLVESVKNHIWHVIQFVPMELF